MTDAQYANLAPTRRKAVILWEMLDRPLGEAGIDIIQTAVEQSTDEQIKDTLRWLQSQ